MTLAALLWIKANARLSAALALSAVVVGFILLALHWKAEAERQADLVRPAIAAAKSTERHAEAVQQATKQNQEEIDGLRKIPGAETPTDPAERAALCASLERMRHKRVCNP